MDVAQNAVKYLHGAEFKGVHHVRPTRLNYTIWKALLGGPEVDFVLSVADARTTVSHARLPKPPQYLIETLANPVNDLGSGSS